MPLPQTRRTSVVDPSFLDGGLVELDLLLPAWQAEVLETAAQQQGLTTGQMLRQLVRDFCMQRELEAPCQLDGFDADETWSDS